MLKLKMMSAWWCRRWSSSVAIVRFVSQCVKPPPPPAWIMRLPSTGRHRWTGLFHPQRGWSLCKNNWKEPRSILMSSADRVTHIDGQLMQLLWAEISTRAQRSINAQSNKTEQSIYECLLGFCFNNIFCAATNFGCIDIFFCPIGKRRNDEKMVLKHKRPCFEQ